MALSMIALPMVFAIIDDDSASSSGAIDTAALTAKVISKISATLATEIKTVLDANSGTLNSSSATYTQILVDGNASITDATDYISSQITAESAVYDDIISAVMSLTQQWMSYLRGPTQTNAGNKIDAPSMATDVAALTMGIDAINLTTFEGTAADALLTAIAADIFTNSGFKFNGQTEFIGNLSMKKFSHSNKEIMILSTTKPLDQGKNLIVGLVTTHIPLKDIFKHLRFLTHY